MSDDDWISRFEARCAGKAALRNTPAVLREMEMFAGDTPIVGAADRVFAGEAAALPVPEAMSLFAAASLELIMGAAQLLDEMGACTCLAVPLVDNADFDEPDPDCPLHGRPR